MPRSAGCATSVRYASMTMSCDADRNTMKSSTPATRLSDVLTPNAASAAIATAIVSWNSSSHPRRRPSHVHEQADLGIGETEVSEPSLQDALGQLVRQAGDAA